jgi:hypothetical protein
MVNFVKVFVWAIVIAICLLLTWCNKSKPVQTTEITTSISYTVPDSTPVLVVNGRPPAIHKSIENAVPQFVDTAAILRSYYKTNVYADSILIDSSYRISIRDSISENSIKNRLVHFQKLRGDKVVIHTIREQMPDQKTRPEIMLGVVIGTGRTGPMLGPSASISLAGTGSIGYSYETFNQAHLATIHINPFRKK